MESVSFKFLVWGNGSVECEERRDPQENQNFRLDSGDCLQPIWIFIFRPTM